MGKKPRKTKLKKAKFEEWEIDFMKNGPPDNWKESPHRWYYLDGFEIYEKFQKDPDFNIDDFRWAKWAYKNKDRRW